MILGKERNSYNNIDDRYLGFESKNTTYLHIINNFYPLFSNI